MSRYTHQRQPEPRWVPWAVAVGEAALAVALYCAANWWVGEVFRAK